MVVVVTSSADGETRGSGARRDGTGRVTEPPPEGALPRPTVFCVGS